MKKNKFIQWLTKPTVFKITVKEVSIIVWCSLIASLIGVLNYEARWIVIPSQWSFLVSVNSIINQLLVTYITGLFFYFLIELLYKTKKKVSVYTSVSNNILLINERIRYMLNEIGKRDTYHKIQDFDLDVQRLRELCTKIDVDIDKPQVWFYPDMNFREYVTKSCTEIKIACDEVLNFSELFNEKWASSLSSISGLSSKIIKSFEVRFPNPKIEFYYLWGMYGESIKLEELQKEYDKKYFRISMLTKGAFHPTNLTFPVNRKF